MTSQARIAELRRNYEAKHAFATQVRAQNNPSTRQKLESAEKLIRFLEDTEGEKDTSKEGSGQAQLRGGGSDRPNSSMDRHRNFEDVHVQLYNQLLKQNTDACSDSRPSPCTEAWMKLASLLQMRNSYLEHQVKELKDENDSLGEDVTWHLEQLGDLEQDLNEAQAERAAALADVLDLEAQTAFLVQSQIPVSAVLDGDESTYTDMTSSGSSIHTIDSDANIASGLTYGL